VRAFGEGGGSLGSHGGLSLRRYVAIGALLRSFPRPRKAEVLAQVGMADKDWEGARACWMAALRAPGDEAATLLERWSAEFDEAWETLQADPPSMEDLESARARAAVPAEVPTYLRPFAVQSLQSTMPSLGVPTIVDLPFSAAIDAPQAAQPVPATMRSKLRGTMAAREPIAPGRVLPFPSASPVAAPPAAVVVAVAPSDLRRVELTVEQYASLTVELRFFPNTRAAILARYGIVDEAAFAALEAAWTPRIAWEPGVVARWSDACSAYRTWLLERTRAGR